YTEDAESELTLKDNPNDTHSSHLYRNLHNLLISTGKIPAICEQALVQKGEALTLKNCASVQQAER
ncbi:MAG: hypothetical protein KDD52_09460, partial [Bdellovibrionales bacterium]|nr:hypothetical protein [Bdellovibrionales bacterium]